MKKVWMILCLAVLALFLAGCAQQAGRAGETYVPVPAPYRPPVVPIYPAQTVQLPTVSVTSPGAYAEGLNIVKYTSPSGTFEWNGKEGRWTPTSGPTRPANPPVPGGTIGVTYTSQYGTFTWDGDSGEWKPTATAPAGAPSEQIVSFTMNDGTKLPLENNIGQPAQSMWVKIGGQWYHAGAKLAVPLPRTDVVASVTTASGKTIPAEGATIGTKVKMFIKLKDGWYEVTSPIPATPPVPAGLEIGYRTIGYVKIGDKWYTTG